MIAFATKAAGNKRVLRPLVEVNAAFLVGYELDYPVNHLSPSLRKIARTNLDGSVVALQRYGKREYQLAVKIADALPRVSTVYGGSTAHDDAFSYYRANSVEGVYLALDLIATSVSDAEAGILQIEAITSSEDRTVLVLPRAIEPVLEQARALFAAAATGEDYYSYASETRQAQTLVQQALKGFTYGVRSLVQAVVQYEGDPENYRETPFTITYVGKPLDTQRLRDEAHAEAIALVVKQRAELAQQRYALQQEIPVLRDAVKAALEADALQALALANALTDLQSADDDTLAQRFTYSRDDDSLYYSRVDTDRSKSAVGRLQEALQGLRWVERDTVRQTVLAGEDF